jgi:tetratricopeptide (TPR) repeat protein
MPMTDSMTNTGAGTSEGMKRVIRLLSRIAHVGELGDAGSGTSAGDVAALVALINQEYRETTRLEVSHQIPYFVFERLIEALGRRLERVPSKQLLAALRALPHGIANAKLIQQQTRSLLRTYDEHLSRHPTDANVRVDRATLNLAERRFEAVLEDCAVLRASAPAPEQTSRLEVEALIGLKEYEAAYECLGRMLDADANDFFALYQRGQLHAAFHYAAEALADATRLEQSSEPAHALWCAGLYLSENRAADALRACQRVLDDAPHDPEALFLLGEAELCSGAWEASRRAFAAFLASAEPAGDEISWQRRQQFAIRRIADIDRKLENPGKALDGYGWLLSTGVYDYWAQRSYVELAERWLRRTLPSESPAVPSRETTPEDARPLIPPDGDVPRVEANMEIEHAAGGPLRIRIIDPENIVYLERLPWSAVVEELELVELSRDNRAGFTALFELDMPALRSLLVRAERFGYACARKLLEVPFFHNLTALQLPSCSLDAPALEMIAARLPPALTELSLSHNPDVHELPFPHRFTKILAESSVSPRLSALDLTGCGLDGEDIEILLANEWPSMRSLKIGGNDLRSMDVKRFLELPLIARLNELRIGHSGIEKELLSVILDRLPDMKLEILGVEGEWTDAEVSAAVAHRNFGNLIHLDLGTSHIPEADWQALLESVR